MKREITAIFAVCLMLTGAAQAATVSWVGPDDGDWNTATNWNFDYVPGTSSSDIALFGDTKTGNVTTDVAPSNNVTLTMRNGGVLNISANMDISGMNIGTTGDGKATINHTAGTVDASFLNMGLSSGSLTARYTLSGSATLNTLNNITLFGNSILTISGSGASVDVGNNDDMNMYQNAGLKFVFDATDVGAINVSKLFFIGGNAQLTIDASAYTGGAATFDLVTFGTNSSQFATNNITIIGANGSVGYDADSMFVNLDPYAPGEIVLIGKDDFDKAGIYASRKIAGGINNTGATWGNVSRDNVEYWGMIDTSVAAGGVVGLNTNDTLGFLGTNKTDNIFGMYRSGSSRTLTYTFNITGYTNLNVAMDWATSGDIADKNVSMTYSIDGAAPTKVFDVGTSGANWSETMDNGTVLNQNRSATVSVNGSSAASLSDEFQTYNPTIPGTGSELTLTFVMGSTVGGYGGMGMDNLQLYGTVSDTATLPEIGSMSISPLPGGTQVALSWSTAIGYSYGVQARNTLGALETWSNIITNQPGNGSTLTVTNAVSADAEFYRAYLED